MRSTEKYRSYKGCWKRRRKDTREQQKNLKTSGENWTMNNRSFYNSRSMSKIKGLNFDRYLDTSFILMENNCAELQIIFGFMIEVPLTSSSFMHTNEIRTLSAIHYMFDSDLRLPLLVTFVVLHLSGPFISDILSDTGHSLVGMSR